MKKKVRQITVENQNYVWWYGISERVTVLYLSPVADKTNIVRIEFAKMPDMPDGEIWSTGMTYAEKVGMTKGGERFEIKIISPKMAAMLIAYLAKERPETFGIRNNLTGGFQYNDCFKPTNNPFFAKQKYEEVIPYRVIKFYHFYLMNMRDENIWYRGREDENGNWEYDCYTDNLEEAFECL